MACNAPAAFLRSPDGFLSRAAGVGRGSRAAGGWRVYRHDGTETIVDETGALDGEDVLPGFSCALATIL